ncbi:antibiotic acetyltransferase [Hanamia caeni]|jgi:acetyltransferase-like isoleucine patch superfamily enzyme|uniref:Antibiotic acetyltransferase n=1 Tax=Hanamia caeni TaxID=2294116 RepID=A0A3M9NBM7_9BACT|nr:CatB-related O-acetyltransferase [Hanamia caeni]RNI35210.1 antibiotic acetyltransferase [Hanamia caeni]
MRKIKIVIGQLFQLPARLFSKSSLFVFITESHIDPTVAVLTKSRIYWSVVGRYSYVADHCWIIKAEIGNFCSIASNVMIGGGSHPVNFVSTSPVFYSRNNILNKCFAEVQFQEYVKTVIGNDVWIGSNAFVKGGITIGNGAIIGAHSVVTKDVEPYSIVAGNPARVIRKRFDDDVIKELEATKWWEYSDEKLQQRATHFQSIEDFLSLNRQQ